jgi:TPR repeat protein
MNEEDTISLFYAKSHIETYKVLLPLAQKGNKFASYFIGNMLISPIDQTVEVDILAGLSYLKLSAKAGYTPALEFLGNLYAYNEKVENNLVAAHTFFYLSAIIENKIDIGYHLIIEDEFNISVADINKSKEIAKFCVEVGLEDCELLK